MSIETDKVDALRRGFDAMVVKQEALNVGDIVIKHPDLPGCFRFPTEDEPAIIAEWLARPFYGYEKGEDLLRTIGGTHGAIRYDCIILVREEDGDIAPFLFDSRRLKKVS
ncbi:hypothetical protein KNV79_gp17 [Salmonella phage vB_SalP_TR2]|uniref:Uncharacterized protein n=1 Tax=Salmonella phage vB_SalP_TR2 TaxID=2812854 RepID=A0A898KAL7_9CAUD|nr:hypothetical protein KNV79_gp17 [Salmonella phage vB_SalP_TR2]QSJ03993.1 hypothetical protein [Salmonella phage vB_SalP_TR2]